jgi:hypothetical protein
MKASELRIGNWVRIKGSDGDLQLAGLYPPFEDEIESTEPIPLTEEWLLKLGFTYHKLDQVYLFKAGRKSFSIPRYNKKDDFLMLYQENVACGYNDLRYLDYVHQVQNLVFSISDQELIVK